MEARKIDLLNIALILVSLILAFQLPFQLFLFAYAIVGPLHYLTEINWLHEKKYFVNDRRLISVLTPFALIFAVPFLFELPFLARLLEPPDVQDIIGKLTTWINALVFLAFVLAVALVFFRKTLHRVLLLAVGVILALFLRGSLSYNIWVGVFLPTVIHVYVFTILFMLYGTLRSRSKPGMVAVALAVFAPLVNVFADIVPTNYQFSDQVKELFVSNNFHVRNALLAEFLGLSDGKGYFFYEVADLKIQIFISFAYVYHYLNWFSKTSIIGWHKNLTTWRSLRIGLFWLFSVMLVWYDYQTGVVMLLFLSMLHVFLEFPLNVVSVRGIFAEIKSFCVPR